MRVGILNDLPVAGTVTSGTGSGAELTIGRFVAEGVRRGHGVDVVTPDFCSDRILEQYDLLVTKNVTAFSREHLGLVMRQRFVAWPSDYAWTRWRLFFSFQEEQRRLSCIPFWNEFFTKSLFNVFLSPLHEEAYRWALPSVKDHPAFLSPPPIDEAAFRPNPDGWIPNTACTINGGLPFKGLKPNLSWAYAHPEVQFSFIGSMRDNVQLPPNARFVGYLPFDKLCDMLSRTETYVELPDTVQPFNQTSCQGLLACKRIETNENLGAASWPWFQKGERALARQVLRDALPDLWSRLEKEAAA